MIIRIIMIIIDHQGDDGRHCRSHCRPLCASCQLQVSVGQIKRVHIEALALLITSGQFVKFFQLKCTSLMSQTRYSCTAQMCSHHQNNHRHPHNHHDQNLIIMMTGRRQSTSP